MKHRAPKPPKSRHARRVAVIVVSSALTLGALSPFAYATFKRTIAVSGQTNASGSLAAPTNLECSGISGSSVTLTWDAVSGVSTPSLLRYTVKRKTGTSSSTAYTNVATNLTTTSYTEAAAGIGSYSYVVSASYRNWTGPNSTSEVARFFIISNTCVEGA